MDEKELDLGNEECNYCGGKKDLETVLESPGFYICGECRQRFETQDQMIKEGLEIQPELE